MRGAVGGGDCGQRRSPAKPDSAEVLTALLRRAAAPFEAESRIRPYERASESKRLATGGTEIFITAARGRLTELRDEIAAEGARLIKRRVNGGDDTLWRDLDRLITERDNIRRALAAALKRTRELI